MADKVDTSHLRGWRIVSSDTEDSSARYYESIFTLGNGLLGVRGSYEEAETGHHYEPLTLIAEVYDDPGIDEKPERLAPAPNWLRIDLDDGSGRLSTAQATVLSETRTLDMKRGILQRHTRFQGAHGRITSVISSRLVSQARPKLCAIAYSILPENYSGRVKITSSIDGAATYGDGFPQIEVTSSGRSGSTISLTARTLHSGIDICVAARHRVERGGTGLPLDGALRESEASIALEYELDVEEGRLYTLEKTVAIDTSFRNPAPMQDAMRALEEAPDYAALEKEHAAEWARYWADADIRIKGDRVAQTMARFWVFQLLQAASNNNVRLGLSASIPAKTLSGPGYNGHIFWDTEIYMLPFFSQQYPDIAKSLLGYRYDRLDTARANASAEGRRGARFPWESASTGIETTPKWCATGWMEIHVIADIAFAAWQHYLTTGDTDFLYGRGLELILDTARYWSTRAERVESGGSVRFEISGVIGPDEFHDDVANSVFTNAMARWNLNKALELLQWLREHRPEDAARVVGKLEIADAELALWRQVADGLKINFDPETGLYEEFDGYFALEGHARRIKQADVLLMLHLLPEMRTTDIFRKNFDVYYPVTTHESSLSAAVHVLFALDIGRKDAAYRYEMQSCAIDGARRGGATDAGLHAASLGGGWSSIVAGFGGVRVMPDHLRVAPDLPRKWKLLEFGVLYRGLRLRFIIQPDLLQIEADDSGEPVPIELMGKRTLIRPGETLQASW